AGPNPTPGGTLLVGRVGPGSADFHGTPLAVADLTVYGAPGGTALRAGDVTVSHQFTWYRGALGGAGTTTVAAGGALRMIDGDGGYAQGLWTLDGRALDNRGTATVQVASVASADLQLSGGAVVTNHGTITAAVGGAVS